MTDRTPGPSSDGRAPSATAAEWVGAESAGPVEEAIAQRVQRVEAGIAAACRRAGRAPSEVRLLPISKTQPVSALRAALAAGCHQFGENRVQELVAKAQALADQPDLRWVLVGHLQTNKARAAVQVVAEIQSLDSLKLAAALQRQCESAGRVLDVLVEVNTSQEASKFGVEPAAVPDFTARLSAYDRLRPRGLMTVALPSPDPLEVARCFEQLADLKRRLRDRDGGGWHELSMGMSQDYKVAIEHGSTCVRVGTAIFGARPRPLG
jgi:pyridoxal phosphate enzyme (YggS family)